MRMQLETCKRNNAHTTPATDDYYYNRSINLGPKQIGLEIALWVLDGRHDDGKGRKVNHLIGTVKNAHPRSGCRDIGFLKLHPAGDVVEIGTAARRIVVDHSNLVAFVKQQIDQVAADKPRAAGDDGFHG